ncbi:MAG: hypothetical protein VKJ06_01155 [Vampirovibrionales bacterium]|nr:hypothetical protein [Vampirovibrionales bacterium]
MIYASSPLKEIIGIAKVKNVLVANPRDIWEATKKDSGISRKFFDSYFEGKDLAYAIELEKNDIFTLEKGVRYSEFKDFLKIPQSFKYITQEFFENIFQQPLSD